MPPDYAPPGAARWHTLRTGPDAGRTMFFYDHRCGEGPPEQTVLLVHGNPECSYTFRHVVAALEASGRPLRIVACDHIGFGLSDLASFQAVDMHHADNLRQLVRALDLRDVTLVVHDWGGPIGAGAFLDDPDRVSRLVVVNSTIFPMPAAGITYRSYPFRWLAWSWTPRLVPSALWGGVAAFVVTRGEPRGAVPFVAGLARSLVRFARRRHSPATPEGVFGEQFRPRENALASKRHVRQTPVWGHGYRYTDPVRGVVDNTAFYRRLQEELPTAWRTVAVAGLFGGWDPCGKPEVLAQWRDAFPRIVVDTFPEHGHFLEEHRGPEIAARLLALG